MNTIIIQTNQKQSEKNSKMETIWKTKHNIPSHNPKLLERSYKIPRPCIVFPWRNDYILKTTRCNRHENLHTQRNKNHKHKHILTFNKATTPTSIRIDTKIETYIPNPLRRQKCQKYWHPKDKCTRPPRCAKCGKSNHTELECQNPVNHINCTGEHPAYSQEWEMWKKEKGIREIKSIRNISFPEARKIEHTQEQPSCNKKGNEEKEDTKPKQEELNKLINELKNLIEILKMIKRQSRNTFQQFQTNVRHTTKIRKKNLSKEKKSKLNKKH